MFWFLSYFPRDDFPSKRPCIEPPCALGDDDYNVAPVHPSWTQSPILYPSLVYQQQSEAIRYQLAHGRTSAVTFPENFTVNSAASKFTRTKNSCNNGYLPNLQVDRDASPRFDSWGLTAESPRASVLTDDEILEMVLAFSFIFHDFVAFVNLFWWISHYFVVSNKSFFTSMVYIKGNLFFGIG